MLLGPRRSEGRRIVVIVKGVFKGNRVVANRAALFLEPHDDRLRRVLVQKGKHIQQHLLVAKPRISIRMVDMQLVIPQSRADIQIPQPAVQLHAQVPVLALQLLGLNLVRHGVVRAGDAEAGDAHVVGYGGHPSGVILAAGVEAVERLVAAVAGRAGGARACAEGDERVEERRGEEEDQGHEAGGEAAAAMGMRKRLMRAEGLDGE